MYLVKRVSLVSVLLFTAFMITGSEQVNEHAQEALKAAVLKNDKSLVGKVLTEFGATSFDKRYLAEMLALASSNNNIAIAELLVQSGARIEWCTNCYNENTSFMEAVKKGNKAMVQLLLPTLGIDTSCDVGRGPNTSYFMRNGGNLVRDAALYVAAEHGHVDIVDLLLKENAHVYTTFYSEGTVFWPLSIAARNKHAKVVQRLLKERCDVDYVPSNCSGYSNYNWGSRALDVAILNDDSESVDLLIDHGASLEDSGELMLAVEKSSASVVRRILRDRRVNVNAASPSYKRENTPLMRAIDRGSVPVLSELLKAKDIQVTDEHLSKAKMNVMLANYDENTRKVQDILQSFIAKRSRS